MQVRAFLERYPPYDELEPEALDRVVDGVEIAYFPAGETILRASGTPARALYVVRTGAVELLDDGRLVDLLGEGESFGQSSLLSGLSPLFEVRAHEDTLCYLVDEEVAEAILGTAPGLAFLAASLRRRAIRAAEVGEADLGRPRFARLGDLIRRPPVAVDPGITVEEAAAAMARERISSLLVLGTTEGIVTDRDLRTKVLATGRSPSTPVGEIASSPLVSADADTTGEEAILLLLDHGIHHLPVRGADGALIGMVTDTDLLGLERADAFALRGAIERAPDHAGVARELRMMPTVVAALVRAGIEPLHVGHVVATGIDTATRRLIELAVVELGEPPGAWAWLALGSQARHEQALMTDQDHGLAFDAPEGQEEQADRYFEELARRVTDGLEAAGIPRCRGGVMAERPLWRRTVEGWVEEFRRWIEDPSTQGKVFTNIALDYRRVAGPLDVEPEIDRVVREAPRHPGFLRRLARAAVDLRPPTGFLRELVVEHAGTHAGTLDVKGGGITPLTSLARAYAAAAGLTGNATPARLRGAVAAGVLDDGLGTDLLEAFRLLWRLRVEHQVACVEAGRPPDDHVDPASLGTIARGGLKEAFRTIARAQRDLSRELGLVRA